MPGPQPIMAPDIDEALVRSAIRSLCLPDQPVEIAINVLLIQQGDRHILVDTGSGSHYASTEGLLPQSLRSIGIQPEAITDIFITHVHRDHVGGIIDQQEALIFPHAQYYIERTEYDFWTGEHPDYSRSKAPAYPEKNILFYQKVFKKIQHKITFYHAGDTLFECLHTEAAPGHTPGHIVFTLSSGGRTLTHMVDIAHHQLLLEKPDWGIAFDVDFLQGIQTRHRVLNQIADTGVPVMSCHLPWPGLGYIKKDNDRFVWIPLPYATPGHITV